MYRDDVCGIIVTFHPDEDLPERARQVLAQIGTVFIIDNGSDDAEQGMLRGIAARQGVTLIANHRNLGVASALNIGIRQAVRLGFSAALLLDQDTWVSHELVETLLDVYTSHPERERLAVIGSGFEDIGKPSDLLALQPPPATQAWVDVDSVITSGSLLPLAIHALVGPFREEFFIDHVDTEYCSRARARGFKIVKTRRTLMTQLIGAPTGHQFLWMRKWTTNHSADRRYYMARNGTVMLREFGNYRCGLWAAKSLQRCIRLCKRITLYETDKLAKIAAVCAGWRDGVRGRMGPRVALSSQGTVRERA